MNLPNKLTLLRIALIPIFVLVFYIPALRETSLTLLFVKVPLAYFIGALIFIIASFTDFLDGSLARKYNLVTTFGKFLDPLADKLLVASALLVSIELKLLPAWIPIIIISREFMVTGIRLLAIGEGKVIAASGLGKAKTVTQIIMISALFLLPLNRESIFIYPDGFLFQAILVDTLVIAATVLTIWSGWDYFAKNKQIIFSSK